MLRLPSFKVERPESVEAAVALLVEHGEKAQVIAGGTDIVPNMKHELFTPEVLVALEAIEELRGVRSAADGTLTIGAMTALATVASDPLVNAGAPALAQAAGLVAGPQLRRMGTLGGNVLLDTRCQWYNQTYFWREALGFCLKRDGELCHVVEGGGRCVAAASNDSAPALMSLGARLHIVGPDGHRTVPISDFWAPDGIYNKHIAADELLVEIEIPPRAEGHRGAYGKLRQRGTIDFPLFGVAARLDLSGDGSVQDADVCVVALAARPLRISRTKELMLGTRPGEACFEEAAASLAEQARKQCHPLENVPGDPDYRREMIPVYTRRTLFAAASGAGPVHAL